MTDAGAMPRATYRLQLTKDFTFAQAGALAPYLEALGISHAYLSPILKARKGSTHGYDTVDHTLLNPELGTRATFEDMAARFRQHGIGIILDIVPNHMGIGGDENPYWLDVLERGRASRYADWFDINWSPSEATLRNKILVPFLGSSFGEALDRGALELRHDAASNSFAIWAEGSHKLPISAETYRMIVAGQPGQLPLSIKRLNSEAGRAELAALIDAQHWRPARFSVAADDINYRRFFIVSDLAAIRIERQEVFDHVHRLIFDLVRDGLVQGLRVDHIDGLYDPKAFCLALRQKAPRPIYLVVEKILAPHELLRADWGVDGTTGYEFASAATRLLADPSGDEKLTRIYQGYTGNTQSMADIERDAKRSIIDIEMAAELDALTVRLRDLAASHPRTADLSYNGLRTALAGTVAAMPVYRTYVDEGSLRDEDARNIEFAIAKARLSLPALDPPLFDFVASVMRADLPTADKPETIERVVDVARRIQQYTGPVMAKGLEDTALYRYNRLIALSDVGEKPDRYSETIPAFHDFNSRRQQTVPLGMLATSSHDSKRGEDARARIAALSGYVDEWSVAVDEWTSLLQQATAPELDANDRYYFFQLLLGSWPTDFPELGSIDADRLGQFRERLAAAMHKSVREARLRTNWNVPAQDYESKVGEFVKVALVPEGKFLASFRRFERKVAPAGAQNGLIETVLKLTSPGVPDIYQGAELWEQSMVDPDNRRAVDFDRRSEALLTQGRPSYRELIAGWRDARLKQRIIADLLALRASMPELFACGTYEPLETGECPVCAFVRREGDVALLVAVNLYPWRSRPWGAAGLAMPADLKGLTWQSVLGEASDLTSDLSPTVLFRDLPAAVLTTMLRARGR